MRATRRDQLALLARPRWTYPSVTFIARLRLAQALHGAAEFLADLGCRAAPPWPGGRR